MGRYLSLYTLQQLLAGHRDEEFLHTTHLPDSQCLVPCKIYIKICLGVNEWSETVLCTYLTSLGSLNLYIEISNMVKVNTKRKTNKPYTLVIKV